MADFKKLADETAAKAALASVKDRARKAIEDLTLTDEERAQREAEREREARIRKWKWIGGGIVGVLAFFAIMGLVAKLWAWFLALAIVAGLAYALYFYVRPKVRAVKVRVAADREEERGEESAPESARESPRKSARESEADAGRRAAEAARAAAREKEAARAAAAAREQAIEDELAALKEKNRQR